MKDLIWTRPCRRSDDSKIGVLCTHVVPPGDVVRGRVGLDVALEVDVVALLDLLRVQARSEGQLRRRHVCLKEGNLTQSH